MSTLAEVRVGLAARIDTIDGLQVTDHVPGQAVFPAAFVIPPTWNRDNLDDSDFTAIFQIAVMVGSAIAENQRDLYDFIEPTGPRSIRAAIEADRTLGGLDVDALFLGWPRQLTFDEMAAYQGWGQMGQVQVFL